MNSSIPVELRARRQWVTWIKDTKAPCNPRTGLVSDGTDPVNWATYDEALTAARKYGHAGVGFAFSPDDPFTGIDLDDCIDDAGELQPWAREIVDTMNTYTEVSPSGNGVKMWVVGDVPRAVKEPQIEIYSRARYFTVTGNHLPGTPCTIRNVNGELTALCERLRPAPKSESARPLPQPPTDGDTIRKWCMAALEGERAKMLAAGDGERHNRRYASAYALGGLLHTGGLTEPEIVDALAVNFGKDRGVAEKTILDGIAAGKEEPRVIPEQSKRTSPMINVDTSTLLAERPDVFAQLNAYPNTDAGNAECLELLYRDELRYCHDRKKWFAWDSNRWVIDGDGTAERHALDVVRVRRVAAAHIDDPDRARKALQWTLGSESEGKRNAMLSTARILRSFATRVDLYDRDPMLAGVPNGVLDLEHGQHRASRREDYITAQLGADYDPDATCPRWLQFLDEVFAGDAELIAFIQRAVGYSLTGDTREHKLFLCFGHGANGKSVFLDVLSRLLGEYAANTSFDTFDAGRRNEATNDLAALKGKRLVTVIETEDDRRLAEARVKQVTGQDKVTCRFLYGEYFDYRPQFKIWMAMNHKPVINGTDNGIWRRIQLIPFTQSFLEREDKTLGTKLHAELPGILNWALAGLGDWLRDGLGTATAIEDATREYRRESDLVSQWLEECTEREINGRMATTAAIESYAAWCKRNGYRAPTARGLGRRLVELGIESGRTGSQRFYFGLVLLDTPDSDVSDVSKPFSGNSSLETPHEPFPPKQENNVTNVTHNHTPQKDKPPHQLKQAVKLWLADAEAGDVEALQKARTRMAANPSYDWNEQLKQAEAIEAQLSEVPT